jgi:hypothetical protein
MYVDYDDCTEFGAPIINPKRPYGNSSVYRDISEILEIDPEERIDKFELDFSERQIEYTNKVHQEMKIALQIILRVGKFEEGDYESDPYRSNWRKI